MQCPAQRPPKTSLCVSSWRLTRCRLPASPLEQGALCCQPKPTLPWVHGSALRLGLSHPEPARSLGLVAAISKAGIWLRFSSDGQTPSQQPRVPFPKLEGYHLSPVSCLKLFIDVLLFPAPTTSISPESHSVSQVSQGILGNSSRCWITA